MLEEYMCLGGNEVINNARTFGYASTASCPLSWFRCEPCPTLHDAINDWNPAEHRWIELRRNLWINPRAVSSGGAFGASTNGAVSFITNFPGPVTTARRFVASSTGISRITVLPLGVNTPAGGAQGHVMLHVIVTGGTLTTAAVAIRPVNYTGTTSQTLMSLPDLTPGEHYIDVSAATNAAPAAAAGGVVFYATTPVGATIDVTEILVESGMVGPYFDGETQDLTQDPIQSGDIQYVWTGAVDASASVEQQYTVVTQGYSDEPPYNMDNISRAPWYDAQKASLTSRFYGVWAVEVTGVDDSTREASVTESILDGGVVGLVRHASREITVTALLSAQGLDALEYGMSWLDAALAADGCSTHGASCGAVDMTFLASCPAPETPDEIVLAAEEQTRFLHNVTVTSGPLILERLHSNDDLHVAYIVEWTMVAGTPFVFGTTREIPLEPTVPVIIQDVPYNLVPVPSAELSNGTLTLSTNYSTNPSLETNATGWSAGNGVITPAATGARSTELAASGVASYKVSVTTTNSGATGTLQAVHDVSLPVGTGIRYSATVWAAGFVVSGTAILNRTRLTIDWRDASSSLGTVTIGTGPLNGGTISARSLVPPAGAITARFTIYLDVTSWSSGAVLNLFVDALALTVP